MGIRIQYEFDQEYTKLLLDRIFQRYGKTDVLRTALHASDLLGCLRKAWGKRRIAEDQWLLPDPERDPMLQWAQGLQFEDIVSESDRQRPQAYCINCRTVSSLPPPVMGTDGQQREVETCSVCGWEWIVGTPDYRVDGVVHESKQTRKSSRQGPEGAPWWGEQILTYLFFDKVRNRDNPNWGRAVVNWLMGDYGSRRKGLRPRPPTAALEAFRAMAVDDETGEPAGDDTWEHWHQELGRRRSVVLADEMPPLNGMNGHIDSPRYDFECSSCPVGKIIGCEMWIWDDHDRTVEDKEDSDIP